MRDILAAHGVKHLYLENKATLAYADRVRAALRAWRWTLAPCSLTPSTASGPSSPEEESTPRRAQVITDACFEHMLGYIKPGVPGNRRRAGDGSVYEEPRRGQAGVRHDLCLGGKNEPAARRAGDKRIEAGDFVTMDFGANVDGYCTDMTRTVAVGHVSDEQKKVYDTVLKAQLACCGFAKAGYKGCEVDKVARDIIYGAGYEGCFGHGWATPWASRSMKTPVTAPPAATSYSPAWS